MNRILCVIESLGSGGAERQLTGLAVMLKQQGYDVQVWYYLKSEFYLPFLRENGVETRFINDGLSSVKRLFKLWREIRRLGPDAVVSYTASSSMIICVLRLLGVKYRAIVSERSTTQVLDRYERIRFLLYRWADVIVPNSYSQAKFISDNFPRLSAKTNVITNFVDTDYFMPLENASTQNHKVRILCVGRLSEEKNVMGFLGAVRLMKSKKMPVEIRWYGNQRSDYGEMCLGKVREWGIEDVIEFYAETKDIREKYNEADMLCLPSFYEGFPNVICEAMSCGLPIVCSRVCDNPRIVKEGENGFLFNPTYVDEIVDCIERYIALGEEAKARMKALNRQRAVDMFSKKRFVERYMAVINGEERYGTV